MPGDDLLGQYGERIAELSSAIHDVRPVVERAAERLREVLKLEAWREFTGPGGELVEHDDFADFVTADPPRGLGVTLGAVRGLVSDEPAVAARLEQVLKTAPFEPLPSVDAPVWEQSITVEPIAVEPIAVEPVGVEPVGVEPVEVEPVEVEPVGEPAVVAEPVQEEPKETPALRRLREEAPALHHQVMAGELSTHAAMVQAGFRTRTISVPVSKPESTAKALRKNLSREQLVELVSLLSEDL